ncbi:MAG TPA: glyoxalase [Balneola sp.]|jgi:catechol 2,3-dioxygenase-like lactoylglutathione lyase family enzyme|nr:glyoxalase [Bacteroidota bacterium]HCT52000.1 glyoxalase [Balneola sp.]|tara:strand:- start:1326 stop:1697 length:372 start_codon:yes stop_codon:yes gene_type:complete
MKLSFEIYTSKVIECKAFYTLNFDFQVTLELDGFVKLEHKNNSHYELLFCVPHSPFVHPIFHPEFNGQGAILQMEVKNVKAELQRLKKRNIPIVVPLVNEPVNGLHFAVKDPSGLLIDIVQSI